MLGHAEALVQLPFAHELQPPGGRRRHLDDDVRSRADAPLLDPVDVLRADVEHVRLHHVELGEVHVGGRDVHLAAMPFHMSQ
jgi:hypothetical protein